MSRGITFRRWLAFCVVIVWPLNVYYFTEKTQASGSVAFWVHGAIPGAIAAVDLGLWNVLRARRHRTASGVPHFASVLSRYGPWCVSLLPLFFQFRQSSSWTRGPAGAVARYSETTKWGWGGPGSMVFAISVAFALLAIIWRREREAVALEAAD